MYKNYLLKKLIPKLKVSFYTVMPIFCSGSRLSDKGGGGRGDHPDPNMRGGGRSPKIMFSALRASDWSKNKGGPGPPGPLP